MKFDEFIAQKKEQAKPEGIVIDGAFGCQHCFEQADEADYFMVEKILRWTCPDGHISFIEDWSL